MVNQYFSPTYGQLTLEGVRNRVLRFMTREPSFKYQLVIGSDSQTDNHSAIEYVTAIVVHRIGWGGIYFWRSNRMEGKLPLRSRIYQEATLSLSAAEEFLATFKNDGISKFDVEIHVDIGPKGETKEMIAEIVGMIRGSGYNVKTKPYSYAASKVADRHT